MGAWIRAGPTLVVDTTKKTTTAMTTTSVTRIISINKKTYTNTLLGLKLG